MEIRPERPDDTAAIRAVVTAAFGSPVEARLVDDLRASSVFIPELSLVAEEDGRILGHVMITYVTLADGAAQHRVLSLAPLAVDPERHGGGIGSALVRAALAVCDERHEPLVVLQGDPAYYGRLGFEPASGHGIEMDLPSWAPPAAAQVYRLTRDDASIRGRVVYPPAFDAVPEG